jgi:hypothetical protein
VNLENYENELKLSSSDGDFLITEGALENGVPVKAKKVVRVILHSVKMLNLLRLI